MKEKSLYIIAVMCFLIVHCNTLAQVEFPSLSPKGNISQVVGNTTITVEYERPCARDRVIFGELVPWNKVWRTGAAYCTKVSFSESVKVGGKPVAAGTYALFTIPNPDEWVVILNSDTTLYGSYDYDAEKDVALFRVKPHASNRHYETLTIDIDVVPNNAQIYISWVNTQIDFTVETSIDSEIMSYIKDDLLAGNSADADEYGTAASYFYYQNTNLQDGLELADKMIEAGGNLGWGLYIKTDIYERLERYDEALQEIDKLIELAKVFDYQKEENREREIRALNARAKRIKAKM